MQTLLDDIELDIQELKCLMQAVSKDANPALKIVAKRNIQQMRTRLDMLQELLEGMSVAVTEPVSSESSILAERIKPATNLRHAISLNDSFRFTRELFGGDATRMNEMVRSLGEASSLDEAMDIFNSEVHPDEESEAVADFIDLLKKNFS
ncbi:hypothetical protein [Bacteroides helcogenes]|nr:hypothetical protein [Bacteroides helcogenes]MDY5239166.1 hypothetical protein [Bacteroides helcogenes]